MKPRLSYSRTRHGGDLWRCTGPIRIASDGTPFPAFPWGYGKTPEEAYTAWKKLQKRPATPTMDEHATNLGAA